MPGNRSQWCWWGSCCHCCSHFPISSACIPRWPTTMGVEIEIEPQYLGGKQRGGPLYPIYRRCTDIITLLMTAGDERRRMNLACKHRQHEMRTNGSNWPRAKWAAGTQGAWQEVLERQSRIAGEAAWSCSSYTEILPSGDIHHFSLLSTAFPLQSTRNKQNVGHFKMTNRLGIITK